MAPDPSVLAESYLQLLSPAVRAAAAARTHSAEARTTLRYLGVGLFLAALMVSGASARLGSGLRRSAPKSSGWSRELGLCLVFGGALACVDAALQRVDARLWPTGAGAGPDTAADVLLNGLVIGGASFATLFTFRRRPRSGWAMLAGLSAAGLSLAVLLAPLELAPRARGDAAAAPSPQASRILAFVRRGGLAAPRLYVFRSGGPQDIDLEGLGSLSHAAVSRAALAAPGPELFAAAGHLLGHYRHRDLLTLWCLLSLCAAGLFFAAGTAYRKAGGAAAAVAIWAALLPAVISFNLFDVAINYRADDFALGLTGDPAALCRWLIRDEAADGAEPSPAETILFYSHPPLRRRLENVLSRPQKAQPL